MMTRHRPLVWSFAIALLGTSACGGEDTSGHGRTARPGTPGGGGPGQPGGGGTPAENTQIAGICAGVTNAATPGEQRRVNTSKRVRGQRSTSDVQGASDAEIAGMLEAVHNVEMGESGYAETNAKSAAVRDYAHMMIIAHRRAQSEDQGLFGRLSIKPDEEARRRFAADAYLTGFSAGAGGRGADLDREYMRRVILEHQRTVEMIDGVLPHVQNVDLRCTLDKARQDVLAHMEMACWVWDSLDKEGTTGKPGERIGRGRRDRTPRQPGPNIDRREGSRQGRDHTGRQRTEQPGDIGGQRTEQPGQVGGQRTAQPGEVGGQRTVQPGEPAGQRGMLPGDGGRQGREQPGKQATPEEDCDEPTGAAKSSEMLDEPTPDEDEAPLEAAPPIDAPESP